MAIPINALATELFALVAAAWPDLARGGELYLREEEHVNTIDFDILAAQGFPYGVLVIGEPIPIQLGLANRCYLLQCEAWWVGKTAKGSAAQREKAEALAAALWAAARAGTLTQGQLWPQPAPLPAWGMGVPINQTLREMKLPVLAGGTVFGVVVGESP